MLFVLCVFVCLFIVFVVFFPSEKHPKSLFVLTQHGGHLGFYEGGVVPNRMSWLDRLVVEFSKACIKVNLDPKLNEL